MPENKNKMISIRTIRKAVANYMRSEGCGCCQDREAHEKHTKRLAKLLGVPMYDDESGYNFHMFADKN